MRVSAKKDFVSYFKMEKISNITHGPVTTENGTIVFQNNCILLQNKISKYHYISIYILWAILLLTTD